MSGKWNMGDEIRPIRSEAGYQDALEELERLWGSPLGTREGDRLDVLATLIDAYEGQHHPIDPPDPIEAIRFRMEQDWHGAKHDGTSQGRHVAATARPIRP